MDIFESLQNLQILDIPILNGQQFLILFIRYLLNTAVTVLVVNLYYKFSKNKDFFFTFIAFNSLIFFMVYIMNKADIGVGFGFGLFALFSILRYRTEAVGIKEMTYLFVVITIGVINALIIKELSYIELFTINLMIIFLTYWLEKLMVRQTLASYNIVYEKIENITPSRSEILYNDLTQRTGLVIENVKIKNIDFLRDVANIQIMYDTDKQPEAIQETNETSSLQQI